MKTLLAKIEALEALPRTMVGDGKSPNVYFVSMQPAGVVMVAREFAPAYRYWQSLPRNVETCLEDRQWGVICSNEPDSDNPGAKLIRHDEGAAYAREKRIEA